jgi:hypothetical protein
VRARDCNPGPRATTQPSSPADAPNWIQLRRSLTIPVEPPRLARPWPLQSVRTAVKLEVAIDRLSTGCLLPGPARFVLTSSGISDLNFWMEKRPLSSTETSPHRVCPNDGLSCSLYCESKGCYLEERYGENALSFRKFRAWGFHDHEPPGRDVASPLRRLLGFLSAWCGRDH